MDIRTLIAKDAEHAAKKILRKAVGIAAYEAPIGKSVSQRRIAQLLDSLNAAIGVNTPMPAIAAFSPEWLPRFSRFLTEELLLAKVTADERIARLVSYLRAAIRDGLLPNIAITPSGDDDDSLEFSSLPAPDRAADLRSIIALIYAKAHLLETSEALTPRETETLRADIQALGKPLLRILFISESLGLSTEAIPEEFTLLRNLIEKHTPSSPTSSTALHTIALQFPEGLNEPFTEWLEIARAQGIPPSQLRRLITLRFGDVEPTKADNALIQTATEAVARAVGLDRPRWYCIKCGGKLPVNSESGKRASLKPTSGTLLSRHLAEGKSAAALFTVEYFAPYSPIFDQHHGETRERNHPLLDELLFLRANRRQIQTVNRLLLGERLGFIYHTDRALSFAEISESDIRRLRSFLSVKDSTRRVLTDPATAIGTPVQITSGLYAGYQGTITATAPSSRDASCPNTSSATPLFIVSIPGICAVATTAIDPRLLIPLG